MATISTNPKPSSRRSRWAWAAAIITLVALTVSMWIGFQVRLPYGRFGVKRGGVMWIESRTGNFDGSVSSSRFFDLYTSALPAIEWSWPRVRGPQYRGMDRPVVTSTWGLEVPLWAPAAVLVGASLLITVWRRPPSAAVCRSCGYDLRGNVSGVCPECGSSVPERGDEQSAVPTAVGRVARMVPRVLITPWLVVLLLWGSLLVTMSTVVTALVAALAISIHLRRRHWALAATIVLLSPMGIHAALAVADYARGVAKLRIQPPDDRGVLGNIDPMSRCEIVEGGWRVAENRWATEGVYNAMLVSVTRVLGPMWGAYAGPFPSREESLAAVRLGHPCAPEDLMWDRITVDDTTVRLDEGVGLTMIRSASWVDGLHDAREWREIEQYDGPIRVALLHGCLFIRFPEPQGPMDARVYVIDLHSGRPFVCYTEGGPGIPMPVRWHE